jgi:acetolactate synthase-1/2/3 large subunit
LANENNDQVTLSSWLATFLCEKNISHVFHLSGGMTTFMIDAIYKTNKIQIVNTKHEQSAGFAAEGQGRVTRNPGVAFATSGPGATNLITAIASAYFDSTPMVLITGQVNSNELRKDTRQRQNGFQELDICSMVAGITKKSVQIKSAQQFAHVFSEIWELSMTGRPGPVLIDIPIDIQQQLVESSIPKSQDSIPKVNVSADLPIAEITRMLKNSKRPLILAGGGIRTSGKVSEFRELVRKWQIPVVYSLMGKDCLASDDPNKVGLIGSYGNRWANKALAECDLLISIGSRLDVRQTGSSAEAFTKDKYIIRFDTDANELSGRINADLNIEVLLEFALDELNLISSSFYSKEWNERIELNRINYPASSEQDGSLEINPNQIISEISRELVDVDGYVVDVGQHQMWAAQSIYLTDNQRFLTSGGMGAMGFSLPTAIGAQLKTKGRWVVISGDGCAQLSIAELQTVYSLNLNLIIIIFNNHQHGMVAQFQESNLESRFVGTRIGYDSPDFVKVANSFGIPAKRVTRYSEVSELFPFIRSCPIGPILIEIEIPQNAKALPKMDHTMNLGDL